MASNEQVRIDLEARDNASKTIDKVADAVDELEHADPEIAISADDDATRTLDKVADAAAELDKADPTLTITATDKASADIAGVADAADALARHDTELVLKARVDAAKADLAALQAELKQTGERADTTARQLDRVDSGGGSGLRGNAIADLTGPLGQASGAASDFAGVFDGLGDIVEDTALKMGASSATAGKIAGALGGLGVAVAAGAAAWSLWTANQEKARKKIEETRAAYVKMQQAIAEGDIRTAAKEFLELHDDALKAGRALGANTEQIVNFVDGVGRTSPVLEQMERRLADVNAEVDATSAGWAGAASALIDERAELEKTIGPLVAARDAHRQNAGAYTAEEQAIRDATDALSDHTEGWGTSLKSQTLVNRAIADSIDQHRRAADATDTATDSQQEFARKLSESETKTRNLNSALAAMRGELDAEQALLTFTTNFQAAIAKTRDGVTLTAQDILDLKGDIVNVATYAHLNPVQVSALIRDVEQGDLDGVLAATQAELDKYEHWVTVHSKLDRPIPNSGTPNAPNTGPRSVAPATPTGPEVGTVNMHLPAGWRGDPMRAVHATRRRTGRLFAR